MQEPGEDTSPMRLANLRNYGASNVERSLRATSTSLFRTAAWVIPCVELGTLDR